MANYLRKPASSRRRAPVSTFPVTATKCAANWADSSRRTPSTNRHSIASSRVWTTRASTSPTPDDWSALTTLLPADPGKVRVFYLACAPSLFGPISAHLATHKLVDESSRVVLEKPIGHDLASACAINDAVGAVFDESQIFRIDHYLGKESVQNLLVTQVRQHLPGTPVELQLDRPRADHRRPNRSAWAHAAGTTTTPARCATWCRTTCCRCSAWSRWNRRPMSTGKPSATRSSKSCRRSSR